MNKTGKCETCGTVVRPRTLGFYFGGFVRTKTGRTRWYEKAYYLPDCPKCKTTVFFENDDKP